MSGGFSNPTLHQTYLALPKLDAPIIDERGNCSIIWYRLFIGMWQMLGGSRVSIPSVQVLQNVNGQTNVVDANNGQSRPLTFSIGSQTVTKSSTITSNGIVLVANNTGAGITITVDQGVGITFLVIKDILDNANLYPITVVSSIGNIDDDANYIINIASAWVWLTDNGNGFSVIG